MPLSAVDSLFLVALALTTGMFCIVLTSMVIVARRIRRLQAAGSDIRQAVEHFGRNADTVVAGLEEARAMLSQVAERSGAAEASCERMERLRKDILVAAREANAAADRLEDLAPSRGQVEQVRDLPSQAAAPPRRYATRFFSRLDAGAQQ